MKINPPDMKPLRKVVERFVCWIWRGHYYVWGYCAHCNAARPDESGGI